MLRRERLGLPAPADDGALIDVTAEEPAGVLLPRN